MLKELLLLSVITTQVTANSLSQVKKVDWKEKRLAESRALLSGTTFLESTVFNKNKTNAYTKYFYIKNAKEKLSLIAEFENRKIINKIKRGETLVGSDLTMMHKIVAQFLRVQEELHALSKSNDKVISLITTLDQFEVLDNTYTDYYGFRKFRRLINDSDSSYDIQAHEMSKEIRRILKKDFVLDSLDMYNHFVENIDSYRNTSNQRIVDMIIKHPAIGLLKNNRKLFKLGRKFKRKEALDKVFDLGIEITHLLSKGFGNGVGSIRWRKGHLFEREDLNQEILSVLRPLDVITEKTYFALTDTFIPGHFGHNAIWLGTKEQLIENNMWNHPSIIKYRDAIEEGLSIIETDRSGTHLKSLEDFMNIDEFAILRVDDKYLSPEKMKEVYSVALSQIGKTYDFNFDVETTDQLVCSELLYQSFGDIKWPTQKWPGRMAISPDDVTSLALYQNSPIELVYYIAERKKGEFIYKDIFNLADDMGFATVEDEFFMQEKVCKRVYSGKRRTVPGSRIRRRVYTKKCEMNYTPVIY